MGKDLAHKGAVEVAAKASSPPISPSLPAGYQPEDLDKALRKFVAVAEQNIRQSQSLSRRVEQTLDAIKDAEGADALDTANKVTILYDRMVKAGLNLVKATDELSRLRSFLAGGPDSRPDLTVKGEIELRGMVLKAVKAMGPGAISELVQELGQ